MHIDAAKAAHVFNPNFDVVFRNGIVGRRHRREVGGIESVKKMNKNTARIFFILYSLLILVLIQIILLEHREVLE